jgi:uncharacterized repeat protein (TIGR01451 family)
MVRKPASRVRNFSVTALFVAVLTILFLTPAQANNVAPAVESFSSLTTVVSSMSPILIDQPVTFTATVTSSGGAIPDGETVVFYNGPQATEVQIGTGTTLGGTAVFTTASLAAGGHAIIAKYVGDATFKASKGTVKQVINKATTSMTFTSSENPSRHGDPVTFTITVTSNGGPTPTGTVFVTDLIGNLTLINGVARVSPELATGKFHFEARYLGDAANRTSEAFLKQVVLPRQ